MLIFEPDIDGHPREWLQYLIEFAARLDRSCTTWFVVAPEIAQSLMERPPDALAEHVHLLALGPLEVRLCRHRSLIISGLARWWTMRHYLRRTGAQAGHFLAIDHLTLPLACGLGAAGARIGGILFRPSVHYHRLGHYRPTFAERLRDIRKSILYRLMLLNDSVDVVLTLDPYFPTHAARHYVRGRKIQAIVDPAHAAKTLPDGSSLTACFPSTRTILLLFGFLTERKGILVLLDALSLLCPSIAGRIAVIIAGRIDCRIREDVARRHSALAVVQPELLCQIEDRWFADSELASLVNQSDVILAPYQRFVGSSGVVLWAARVGRPLITQDFGLVGRLVKEHGLGFTADTSDPAAVARAIEHVVETGPRSFFSHAAAEAFLAPRTPQHFASTVFRTLSDSRTPM